MLKLNKKAPAKKFFIITGISGAGKTKALQIFGDFGFYCVDNLPLSLFEPFIKNIKERNRKQVALGVDIREGKELRNIPRMVESLKKEGYSVQIVFLNAEDEKLVQRFSETKHKHPIAKKLIAAIEQERKELKPVRDMADEEIDTTSLTLGDLKEKIKNIIGYRENEDLLVSIVSFGFKNGIPLESDMVFDVRFLPNPYYLPELKHKTGLQKPVQKYVGSFEESKEFLKKAYDMLIFLLPKFIKEGKSYVTVSIGCTGGKHRSVYIAHTLAGLLKDVGLKVSEFHRDIKV
ncbi:UPF0042 nucleotide-binding protein [Parelusimicrobium proximum]|uniref:RNase adapter RapZ n=1 Tax=Parelusimicrobium proximum TaxID=3228953 RepID=UPI003D1732B4